MTKLRMALTFLVLVPSFAHAETELARVNGKVITLEEFNRKFPVLSRLYTDKVPTKSLVLDDLIKREVGVQEAKRLKIDQDPEVQDELNTVLYQAYLRKTLSSEFDKIVITDTDAKAWYSRNPEIRTSHIFVSLLPDAPAAEEQKARARIAEIQKELRSGKSFAEVAQKQSEGIAAPMGGDIDYKTKDQLDPAYYQAAVRLGKPGNVSGVIRTQHGLHLIKLTAIRPWDQVDRIGVKNAMAAEKRQEIFSRHMNQQKSRAKVSIKSNLIR